jgi:nicotinamide-nucleotide amidase
VKAGGGSASAYVYDPALEDQAAAVLRTAERKQLRIATAESCTGGALSALLTDVEGLSHAFDRGFAAYCDNAKTDCLDVDPGLLRSKGAVSAEVAEAMANGALKRSGADIAIAITGFAGPAGANDEAGLVYICAVSRGREKRARTCHFGPIGRAPTRIKAIEVALDLLQELCSAASDAGRK